MPVFGDDTTADYGMGLVPIFCFRVPVPRRIVRAGPARTSARAQRWMKDFMTHDELNALLAPVVADLGLELVGIEFSPSSGGSLLRVYIDAPEQGVGIDDCERASREISALLDVHEPMSGHYTLEVSSPGLERPLFTPEHFVRFLGQEVRVNLNLPLDGRRRFQGPIRAVDGDRITIEQDGVPVEIVHANIAKARLVPDYVALGLAPARGEAGAAGRARRSGRARS